MKRFLLSLVVIAGLLAVGSGSALGQAARSAASPPTESSLPTISGTVQAGHTLTASSGTWGGVTPITYAYQWQRCNSLRERLRGDRRCDEPELRRLGWRCRQDDPGRRSRPRTPTAPTRRCQPRPARSSLQECSTGEYEAAEPFRNGTGRPDDHGRQRQLVRASSRSPSPTSGRAARPPTRSAPISPAPPARAT